MDEQVEAYSAEGHALSLLPSEYFRRQCYISFDPGEWNLAASARHIGADRILWASDYPHPEYRAGIVAELMASLEALPEADQRRIAGENAVAAYGLPVTVSG
jgi:predicted TIM-barrel fold metal-dependent hydrolase